MKPEDDQKRVQVLPSIHNLLLSSLGNRLSSSSMESRCILGQRRQGYLAGGRMTFIGSVSCPKLHAPNWANRYKKKVPSLLKIGWPSMKQYQMCA